MLDLDAHFAKGVTYGRFDRLKARAFVVVAASVLVISEAVGANSAFASCEHALERLVIIRRKHQVNRLATMSGLLSKTVRKTKTCNQ